MTSQEIICSAQRSLQDPNTTRKLAQPQYIGGVVVPPSPAGTQKFPIPDTSKNQNSQLFPKSISPVGSPNTAPFAGSKGPYPRGGNLNTNPIDASSGGAVLGMSETSADKPQGSSGHKMRISQSGVLYTLHMIREPVVEYQETRGIPRNEEITFVTLVTSLCTQAYTAAITILVMLWNLMPLVDGLVYFVRFFLDKLIDIVQTPDNKDKAIKGAIFFGELTVVTFIIFMIVGLIFMPVYVLMARLFSKVFSMIAW